MIAKLSSTIIAGFLTLGFAACGKRVDNKTNGHTDKPANEAPTAPLADRDKIGLAACDEWVERYSKCIRDKVPEARRQQMKDALKATTVSWKSTDSTPEGRTALERACRRMIESTKQATASLGCEW